MFKHRAYSLKFAELYSSCKVCGEDFRREPGFYFGAAYVSYGLTVALWIAVYVAMATFDSLGFISFHIFEDPLLFMAVGCLVLLLLFPLLYRWSRAFWIGMFVPYQKS